MNMTENDFSMFSKMLAEIAQHLYRQDLSAEAIAVYWRVLQNRCDFKTFSLALSAHVADATPIGAGNRRGDFMPKPADIISQIELLSGVSRDPSRAWITVESAIRRVGKNRSVDFDDPVIHLTIEAMGGWIRICETMKEDDFSMRKAFGDIYRETQASPVSNAPKFLIGVEDTHNMRLAPATHQIKPFQIKPQTQNVLIGSK